MMSTCIAPMSPNKIIAVIPECNLLGYAKEMEEAPAQYKCMLGSLHKQFLTMYKELGGCASSTAFQAISSAGVMAKIALSGYNVDSQVMRFMDLLVMAYMFKLYTKLHGVVIEVVVGPSTGDWILDFKSGWVAQGAS